MEQFGSIKQALFTLQLTKLSLGEFRLSKMVKNLDENLKRLVDNRSLMNYEKPPPNGVSAFDSLKNRLIQCAFPLKVQKRGVSSQKRRKTLIKHSPFQTVLKDLATFSRIKANQSE